MKDKVKPKISQSTIDDTILYTFEFNKEYPNSQEAILTLMQTLCSMFNNVGYMFGYSPKGNLSSKEPVDLNKYLKIIDKISKSRFPETEPETEEDEDLWTCPKPNDDSIQDIIKALKFICKTLNESENYLKVFNNKMSMEIYINPLGGMCLDLRNSKLLSIISINDSTTKIYLSHIDKDSEGNNKTVSESYGNSSENKIRNMISLIIDE